MDGKNNIHVLSRAVIIDQGHILLCKTIDFTSNFYFLPGGHIEHGESAYSAVLREILEETGSNSTIKRFLSCLEHTFKPDCDKVCHSHEYNLIFELESIDLKLHHSIPQLEAHIQLIWIPLSELTGIDFRPEALKTLIPKWLQNDLNNTFSSIMLE